MVDHRTLAGAHDWRRSGAYDYTAALPRRAWAWEFLRRNRDYQRAWSEARAAIKVERPASHLTVVTADRDLADMARWDVLFR